MSNKFDDDYISFLVYEIEKLIAAYDDAAESKGIRLTDSNVRSVLSKIRKHIEGGNPSVPESNDREKMLSFMTNAISNMIDESIELNAEHSQSDPMEKDWLVAIEAIDDSIKLRKTPIPGGRDYLDYLENFIKNAKNLTDVDTRKRQREFLKSLSPRCGLCGKTEKLKKTECCGNWICDDEDKYVLMSFERNSCSRNHHKFTVCSYHHSEKHPGNWENCDLCRKQHDDNPEMFVYLATNEYNFEIPDDLPTFEPKRCLVCSKIIRQGRETYSVSTDDGLTCSNCNEIKIPDFTKKGNI